MFKGTKRKRANILQRMIKNVKMLEIKYIRIGNVRECFVGTFID